MGHSRFFLLSAVCFALCGALRADFTENFAPPREFPGKAAEAVTLTRDYRLDPQRGATFVVTGRYFPERKPPTYHNMAVLLYKHGEFFFGFRHRRLYFLPSSAGNGKWNYSYFDAGIHAETQLPEGDHELHQFALTISRTIEPEQGIDHSDVKLYQDGLLVAGRRYDHFAWKEAGHPLLAGGVSPSSGVFPTEICNFAGNMESVRIFDRALSDEAIRELVKADKRLKPAFLTAREFTAEETKALTPEPNASPEHRARLSGLANAARLGRIDWRAAAKKGTWVLPGRESFLVVIDDGNYASATSFYDRKAERELFAWDNPFFEVVFLDARKKDHALSGLSPEITRRLSKPPRETAPGVWEFAFAGEHRASKKFPFEFRYTMECRFLENRFEYEVAVENLSEKVRLEQVKFPALRFNSFREGGDTLLVPCMSGVEYRDAAAIGATYAETYPRGRQTMQMGAYYDAKGGVMFAVEDPRARAKKTAFAIGRELSTANFIWNVPFDRVVGPNTFAPGCRASFSLFRGDWYDAGLLYRAMLVRIKAPWWRPTLPAAETPQWFRDNAIWIGRWQSYKDYAKWLCQLDDLVKWKQYIGSPGQAIHFYEWCLHFTRDWPHNPASPDYADRTRAMKRAGYRVMPYINGRIWEDKDKRDEDYRFSSTGEPACLRTLAGTLHPETYGTHHFYVICPATETFKEEMIRECDNCVIYGADGAYLDQIGAAPHHPCYSEKHGHRRGDPDIWYMQGHRVVFDELRKHWKRVAPEAITMGEDIAESVVGVLDGGLTWRWMCSGQVGLFPLVYSGRTQMAGLAWSGSINRKHANEDLDAAPAKLTWQLFNGCQLGWFSIDYVVQPAMRPNRPLIKQYAHLRTAMLDFFNRGMMARPPRFLAPRPEVSRFWGTCGTRIVASEDLQSCAWGVDGVMAVLAANTGKKVETNTLSVELPAAGTLHRFGSGGETETRRAAAGKLEVPVKLAPREFLALLFIPDGAERAGAVQLDRFRKAFAVIAAAGREADPWSGGEKETRR